jgi:MoaA/NifB/PqqE/SkfB family radical SAM enzyme
MGENLLQKVAGHLSNKVNQLSSTGFTKPQLVYLKITSQCNFRCQHCDIWQTSSNQDLTIEDWKIIVAKIKSACPQLAVTLSGGEPLLYKNFWQLIDFFKQEKIQVNLNTNGSLITEENIERLLKYPFNKISVSLYSLNSELHNSFRNTPNAFEKAYSGLIKMAEKRAEISSLTEIVVAFLLNSKNIEELPYLVKHFSEKKIAVSIQALDTNVQPMTDRQEFETKELISTNSLWPKDKAKIEKIFDELLELKNSGYKIYNRKDSLEVMGKYYLEKFDELKKLPCYSGQNNLIVSSKGNAFFCFDGPMIGNLVTDSWENVWRGKRAKETRKAIKKCKSLCRIMNCNFQSSLSQKIIEKMRKMY